MTIHRETSAEAYRFIRPYAAQSHRMILDIMMTENHDWTSREVRQKIIDEGIMPKDKCLSSSISGRMNELKKLGHIIEDGKRVCGVSGRLSIACMVSMGEYRDMVAEEIRAELEREEQRKMLTRELFG